MVAKVRLRCGQYFDFCVMNEIENMITAHTVANKKLQLCVDKVPLLTLTPLRRTRRRYYFEKDCRISRKSECIQLSIPAAKVINRHTVSSSHL